MYRKTQTAKGNKETIFPQKDKLHNKTIKIYKSKKKITKYIFKRSVKGERIKIIMYRWDAVKMAVDPTIHYTTHQPYVVSRQTVSIKASLI